MVKYALGNMTVPEYYMSNEVIEIGKLPFCLIINNFNASANHARVEQILASIRAQKYEKTTVLLFS